MAVRVLASPAGQGEGSFQPPWSAREWPRIRAGLERALRHLDIAEESAAPIEPRAAGEALFRALFSGQVGTLWARSLGAVADRGLRIQIRLKLEAPGPPLLDSFPWELLYQPDTRDFLALSRVTPVVRFLEVPRPVSPLRLPAVLRILAVIAEAPKLGPLDLERERREIEAAWGDGPGVEIVFLKEARPEALRRALLEGDIHVLHFMGHGALDRSTGQGVLFFERGGVPDPVPGESLATLLKDVKTLRLVFLNACETAQTPDGDGRDPFAGVASALVLGGVPAVIAMQLPISDPAAIAFSRTVYLRLADGDPVDAAVTEGRLAIYTAAPGTMEWAIPVLFTRVADGRIFQRRSSRPQDTVTRPVALPPRRFSRIEGWTERLGLRWRAAGAVLSLVLLILLALFFNDHLPRPARKPDLESVQMGTFRIARYEVTQSAFQQFVLANPEWRRGRVPATEQDGDYLKDWISWREPPHGLAGYPVTRVSWPAAEAFCNWVGGRLPTQKEWQVAAHTAERRFPWKGPSEPDGRLNFCDQSCGQKHRDPQHNDDYQETAPVTAFPDGATPEGVFNLSGNVWEWCENASGAKRVTLGGSYLSMFQECSTDKPTDEDATLCAPDGGFRCVWSP
jgi:hypothetical protein